MAGAAAAGLAAGSSAAKLTLAAAPSEGGKQKMGEQLHIGGLDLWRKTPRFYNGAPFRKLTDDHPAAQAGRSLLPHGPAVDAAAAERSRVARGWLHTAHFLTSAPQLEHLPALELPEIAFVGRSNAGKSTAINTLTQQTRLAFASKTPGRTQHINLFGVGKQKVDDAVLADLPGYGYAAVPKEAKLRWQRVMGNYLVTRENLRGVVLMCDPRHGLTELDDILLDVIRPRVEQGLKFLVLLTKADKLTRSGRRQGAVDCATAGRRRRGQTVLGAEAAGRGRGGRAALALGAPAGRAARRTDSRRRQRTMIETFQRALPNGITLSCRAAGEPRPAR